MQENMPVPVAPQQEGMEGPEFNIDIMELLESWRKHISVIILLAVIGGLAAYAYTLMFVVPQYRTSATMYVVSASANSVLDVSDLSLGTYLSNDYIQLIQSRTMLEKVLEDTGDPLTVNQLRNMLTVSNNTGTRILTFTVTSKSPQQAMRIANACVKQAIIYLPKMMGIKDNPPSEIDLAMLPTSPYNMNYMRNMLIGLVAGAVVAMAIYALIEILSDTMDSADDVEKVVGMVPLAVVPENNQIRGGRYGGYGKKYYYYYYSDDDKSGSKSKSDRRSK